MHNLVTAPIRASRHLAIWLVWQSTGVTLLEPQGRSVIAPIDERRSRPRERRRAGRLRQAG